MSNNIAGKVVVITGAGLPLTISNVGTVRAETARFEVTGDIIDNCDSQSRTMAAFRQVYNSHVHPDPQGGNTGTTPETA